MRMCAFQELRVCVSHFEKSVQKGRVRRANDAHLSRTTLHRQLFEHAALSWRASARRAGCVATSPHAAGAPAQRAALARPPSGQRLARRDKSPHTARRVRSLLRASRARCSRPALHLRRPPMRRAAFWPLLAALFAAALVCISNAAPGAPPLGFSAAHRAHAAARGAASLRNAPLRHPRASDEQLATCTVSWVETDVDHFSWVRRRCAPCCAAADLALTRRSCNVALHRPRSAPSRCATLSAAWSSGGPRQTGSPGPYSSTLATCVEAAARCSAPGLRRQRARQHQARQRRPVCGGLGCSSA